MRAERLIPVGFQRLDLERPLDQGALWHHRLGLTREDLMDGVHQFNHPVSKMSCPHVKPAEVYSC
jgi:hypothetical protein